MTLRLGWCWSWCSTENESNGVQRLRNGLERIAVPQLRYITGHDESIVVNYVAMSLAGISCKTNARRRRNSCKKNNDGS